MKEVSLRHVALVSPIKMLVHVVNLTLDELRLHFFEEIPELGRRQLLVRTIRQRVLIEEVFRVNLALHQDFLYFFNNLLSVDGREFIDKLIKVDRLRIVHIQSTEECTGLVIIQGDVHRSNLLSELWEGDITVGVCVHDRKHHA